MSEQRSKAEWRQLAGLSIAELQQLVASSSGPSPEARIAPDVITEGTIAAAITSTHGSIATDGELEEGVI